MKRSSTTRILLLCLALFAAIPATLQAQATLSVQGVLKKSDGTAVDDDTYQVTFTLWKSQGGSSPSDKAWEGMLPVETKGGVYSAVLGGPNSPALTAPFDTIYYLGVKVQGSSQELQPRPLLTHAPYAMSLLGQRNKFPSKGIVRVDTIEINTIKAENDSAGVKLLSNLNLGPQRNIRYNGLSDWRLVQVDDFDNGPNGWAGYDEIDDSTPVADGVEVLANMPGREDFTHNVLTSGTGLVLADPDDADYAFKKTYNLNNTPHTKVKVVFTVFSPGSFNIDGFTPNIYVGTNHSTMNDLQELIRGRNEVILNTDANTFIIGLDIDEYDGLLFLKQAPRIYLDNIEIWVK